MAFTSIDKVRAITNLTTATVSDTFISLFIGKAQKQICDEVNVSVSREQIGYLDSYRTNYINGSNNSFFIKNWQKFIADKNRDGDVTTADIEVFILQSDVETKATVATISPSTGNFSLTTTPSAAVQMIYVNYEYSDYSQKASEIDRRLDDATQFLASAYSYAKKDIGSSGSYKFGNITINKKLSDNFKFFYELYEDSLSNLNKTGMGGFKEGSVKI